MEVFDAKIGLVQKPDKVEVRDVSSELEKAEKFIRELKEEVFVEDLIKTVQGLYPLTNDEVYDLIKKIDKELKPKEEPITEPINA